MSHEQSETIQDADGNWINVYGRNTPQAGQRLPGTPTYKTVEEAVAAAADRSRAFGEQQPHSHGLGDRIGQLLRMWQENVGSPANNYDPRSYMPPRSQ